MRQTASAFFVFMLYEFIVLWMIISDSSPPFTAATALPLTEHSTARLPNQNYGEDHARVNCLSLSATNCARSLAQPHHS